MFARTERLLLRPGWVDDAPLLHAAIANTSVTQMLAKVPWPYTVGDAEAFLAQGQDSRAPHNLVFLRTAGQPRLIGGIGLSPAQGGAELGFWIAPAYWGLGFATEAGRAVLAAAQDSLRWPRLTAHHFIDNPASGHVLRKLGFQRTGKTTPLFCPSRGKDILAVEYARDLNQQDEAPDGMQSGRRLAA